MGKYHRKTELTSEERGEIIGLRKAGWTIRKIAAEVKCSVGAVCKNLAKKDEFGTTANRPRSGRPRATTPSQDKYIRVTTLMDRFRPSHEIAKNIIKRNSIKPVCVQTVRNRQVETKAYEKTKKSSSLVGKKVSIMESGRLRKGIVVR